MAGTTIDLTTAIQKAIEEEANRFTNDFIAKAVVEYERELRKRIGDGAISVADYYFIERREREVVIKVQIS